MGIAERKNRQKQALRERILDASRRIVMREGFAALSMRKIADAIEYSPATLYLHFASRDEIAHALCEEGFAQLLERFVPLAEIADPAARLMAIGRAYVAFGVEHPETYRLIFMEDPSYTGAAFGGAKRAAAKGEKPAAGEVEPVDDSGANAARKAGENVNVSSSGDEATSVAGAGASNAASADSESGAADPGTAALVIMLDALEELKAAGRLSASTDSAVWAEAFWATLHGIVALKLTCPVFPSAPLDMVVDAALNAWLGAQTAQVAQTAQGVKTTSATATGGAGTARKRKASKAEA